MHKQETSKPALFNNRLNRLTQKIGYPTFEFFYSALVILVLHKKEIKAAPCFHGFAMVSLILINIGDNFMTLAYLILCSDYQKTTFSESKWNIQETNRETSVSCTTFSNFCCPVQSENISCKVKSFINCKITINKCCYRPMA